MTDPPRRNVTSAGRIYFGLTVTSARSWSFRAISTGSPVKDQLRGLQRQPTGLCVFACRGPSGSNALATENL